MKNDVVTVKEKTDIVAIIGEHVTLKKAGRHFKGLCPFHNEKSPSFIVSPELQMYKCFGCGESGDVFTFIEKFEGLDFADTLKVLADRAGVKLQPFKGDNSSHKDILFEINSVASKYYHYLLLNHPVASNYLNYLVEKRKLKKETIESFELGAAPEGNPKALFDFLTKKKNYKPDLLVEAGLIFKTDRGQYLDRFRGRIIFPIQNARGAVVALSGRILPTLPSANKLAKYINSPETPIYHKSESLFGISNAREAIKRSGIAIVTEGELDMISPFQSGIKNIVAIKGSALTDSHARILSRLAGTVILALDSDFAGNSAAIKGIVASQNYGLTVKVANLGKYKDPDEFVQADPAGFKKALENATDAWDFIIDVYFKRFDPDTVTGKSSISRELIPYLSLIEDSILKAYYIRQVATKLSVPEEAVASAISKNVEKKSPSPVILKNEVKEDLFDRRSLLEERLFVVGCHIDSKKITSEDVSSYIKTPKVKKMVSFLKEFLQDNSFSLASFVESLPPELKESFLRLALETEGEKGALAHEFSDLMHELKEFDIKEQISAITATIKDLDKKGELSEISGLQSKIGELTNMLANLEKE